MSATDVSQRNIAHATLLALELAENALSPSGSIHSRLFVAIRLVDSTVAYLTTKPPTKAAYHRLVAALDDAKTVEGVGVQLGNLHPDSLIQHGLSVSIHLAQAALAGVPVNALFVLAEARTILRMAAEVSA